MLCAGEARFHSCLHESRSQRPVLGFRKSFWAKFGTKRNLTTLIGTATVNVAWVHSWVSTLMEICPKNFSELKIFLFYIHRSSSCFIWRMQMKYQNNCYSVSRKFVCREFIHQEPCMSMWSEAFTLKLISQVSKLWRDVRLYTDWSIKIKCEKVFRCFRCAWGA